MSVPVARVLDDDVAVETALCRLVFVLVCTLSPVSFSGTNGTRVTKWWWLLPRSRGFWENMSPLIPRLRFFFFLCVFFFKWALARLH